jgi:MAF protein
MHQRAPRLVLASASPRRRELLARLLPQFGVAIPVVDESPLGTESPAALARRLATAKARAIGRAQPQAAVLAADTVVALDEDSLGKPADAAEARAMLVRLRGRVHRVITAVCLLPPGSQPLTGARETCVRMRDYDDAEIRAYVETGDPLDKAGAYAIQDRRFRPVAGIRGCYTNVVGLPLCLVSEQLLAADMASMIDNWTGCDHRDEWGSPAIGPDS